MSMGTMNATQRSTNPTELAPIIKCIFTHLSINDILEFRLVSREWNSISQSFLRNFCKITFHKYDTSEKAKNRTPSTFIELFGEDERDLPFSSFSFSNSNLGLAPLERAHHSSFWKESEISLFCQLHSKEIKELAFLSADIVKDKKVQEVYNITDWLSNSELVKSKDKCNTKLKIDRVSFFSTALAVNLEVLQSIKEISLNGCRVVLPDSTENIRMNPISLHLKNVQFFRNGSLVPELRLNDILDWSRIKDISINSLVRLDEERTEIIMDSNGCKNDSLQLNSLTFEFLDAEATFQSELKTQKLKLINTPLVPRTNWFVRDFEFRDSKIDLCVLPIFIERLSVTDSRLKEFSQPEIMLPALKSLDLTDIQFPNKDFSSLVSRFGNCPNLVNISLINSRKSREEEFKLDISHIPNSVQRLKLRGVLLRNLFNLTLTTETLILDKFSLSEAGELLNYFQTNTFIWKWEIWDSNHNSSNEDVLQFLNSFWAAESNPGGIYVGPFYWKENQWNDWNERTQFENSRNATVMDKQSGFYIFREGEGTAVKEEQFAKIMELE